MIRIADVSNIDESVLVDLLLEYTNRITNSMRGSTLTDQEYKDYKDAIDAISEELKKRKRINRTA